MSLLNLISGGRRLVTLIGENKDKEIVELELDVVETFDSTHSNQISSHTIEKDPKNPISAITDNVIASAPTVVSSCVLSDNLNILSTTANARKAVSARDKLKQLVYWQRSGTLLIMEGYTVGQGAAGKVVNFLKRGIGNFNSELDEPFYIGTAFDKIENIVLGNITAKNARDIGVDISVTLNLHRINIAVAKTADNASKAGTGSAGKSTAKKDNKAETKTETPKKEIHSSAAKKLPAKAG